MNIVSQEQKQGEGAQIGCRGFFPCQCCMPLACSTFEMLSCQHFRVAAYRQIQFHGHGSANKLNKVNKLHAEDQRL